MLEAILTAFAVFTLTFVILRAAEWAYHRLRHTPDWSPHWGTWLFAVLLGVYAFVSSVGR
jgi:amino acid transporter